MPLYSSLFGGGGDTTIINNLSATNYDAQISELEAYKTLDISFGNQLTNQLFNLQNSLNGKFDNSNVGVTIPNLSNGKIPSSFLNISSAVLSVNSKVGSVVLGASDFTDIYSKTNTDSLLSAKINTSSIGIANGVVGLGSDMKINQSYFNAVYAVNNKTGSVSLNAGDFSDIYSKTNIDSLLSSKLNSNLVGASGGVVPLGSDLKISNSYLNSSVAMLSDVSNSVNTLSSSVTSNFSNYLNISGLNFSYLNASGINNLYYNKTTSDGKYALIGQLNTLSSNLFSVSSNALVMSNLSGVLRLSDVGVLMPSLSNNLKIPSTFIDFPSVTNLVSSVNGKQGVISLTSSDFSDIYSKSSVDSYLVSKINTSAMGVSIPQMISQKIQYANLPTLNINSKNVSLSGNVVLSASDVGTYGTGSLYTKTDLYNKTEIDYQIGQVQGGVTTLSNMLLTKLPLGNMADMFVNGKNITTTGSVSLNYSDVGTYGTGSLYTKTDLYNKTEIDYQIGQVQAGVTTLGDMLTAKLPLGNMASMFVNGYDLSLSGSVTLGSSDIGTYSTSQIDTKISTLSGGIASLNSTISSYGLKFLGVYDGTQTITDAGGTLKDFYISNYDGLKNLGSRSVYIRIGDYLYHNGTSWEINFSTSMSSLFVQNGLICNDGKVINLNRDDIPKLLLLTASVNDVNPIKLTKAMKNQYYCEYNVSNPNVNSYQYDRDFIITPSVIKSMMTVTNTAFSYATDTKLRYRPYFFSFEVLCDDNKPLPFTNINFGFHTMGFHTFDNATFNKSIQRANNTDFMLYFSVALSSDIVTCNLVRNNGTAMTMAGSYATSALTANTTSCNIIICMVYDNTADDYVMQLLVREGNGNVATPLMVSIGTYSLFNTGYKTQKNILPFLKFTNTSSNIVRKVRIYKELPVEVLTTLGNGWDNLTDYNNAINYFDF